MERKIKILKAHKCSVKECTNLVQYKGSFCGNCIDKICDDNYFVIFCPFCGSVLDAVHFEEYYDFGDSKIKYRICADCFSQFEIIPGDEEPWDE